jgi:hypothetical protein
VKTTGTALQAAFGHLFVVDEEAAPAARGHLPVLVGGELTSQVHLASGQPVFGRERVDLQAHEAVGVPGLAVLNVEREATEELFSATITPSAPPGRTSRSALIVNERLNTCGIMAGRMFWVPG